jgi:hypothetical protein
VTQKYAIARRKGQHFWLDNLAAPMNNITGKG